jgi:hypothetical protein
VTRELPHTWAAWRTGRITEWTATLIARETACLTREDRAEVDEIVAGDPARVEQLGIRAVVATCQAEAARRACQDFCVRAGAHRWGLIRSG